jgi:hypothetical protein
VVVAAEASSAGQAWVELRIGEQNAGLLVVAACAGLVNPRVVHGPTPSWYWTIAPSNNGFGAVPVRNCRPTEALPAMKTGE